MKKFLTISLFSFLFSSPCFSSHINPDDEILELDRQDRNWHKRIPADIPVEQTLEVEEPRPGYPSIPQNLGGNFMCGATYLCGTLLGVGGGIAYLYAKYPVYVVNGLLEILTPPIAIGAAACGTVGCIAGYCIKKKIDQKNQ